MFVSVLNLRRHRKLLISIKIVALVIVVTVFMGACFSSHYESKRYIHTMQEKSEKNLIIIDAGHGGEDPGAIGDSGVYEKDLNLEIAFELGQELSKQGFAVMYTRTQDKLLYSESENIKGIRKISDLKNRCKIAAEYPSAIFVSIHMNSYGSSKYSGLQVYYSTENDDSYILAGSIQQSVKESIQPNNNRVVKPGNDIYVLENTQNCAVLIECGFITNKVECEKLLQKEYQKQLSLAIVCGIMNYREKILEK